MKIDTSPLKDNEALYYRTHDYGSHSDWYLMKWTGRIKVEHDWEGFQIIYFERVAFGFFRQWIKAKHVLRKFKETKEIMEANNASLD